MFTQQVEWADISYLHHGYQIWPQSGSDWPQMGQIRKIFRSDLVHFGAVRQNVLNLIWKISRICPIWGQFDPLWDQILPPCCKPPCGRHTASGASPPAGRNNYACSLCVFIVFHNSLHSLGFFCPLLSYTCCVRLVWSGVKVIFMLELNTDSIKT